MVAGFDRYFQIAPCFRDEDARADRSPGEFYQLDVELSFVTQDDVFSAIEPVLAGVFREFSSWNVTEPPFPRIAYDDAMVMYGSDKPDLRNPIRAADVTEIFRGSEFAVFAQGRRGRRVGAGDSRAGRRREVAQLLRQDGRPGRVAWPRRPCLHRRRRPAARAAGQVSESKSAGSGCSRRPAVKPGDAVFFASGPAKSLARPVDGLRTHLGRELGLIEANAYRFCWITDFPFYELDPETGQVAFSHNPFSMPQGGLEALNSQGSADDQGLPVRHRLQRRRAVERRDPQPSARHHAAGVRNRRVRPGRGSAPFRRHAQRVSIRRTAARRPGAGHRSDRDAARPGAEPSRGHRISR